MSSAAQSPCAATKIGTSKSGVHTYRIRSRQLSRIHKLDLRSAATGADAAGTVCADDNPGTICMPLAEPSFYQTTVKINPITTNKYYEHEFFYPQFWNAVDRNCQRQNGRAPTRATRP